MHLFYLHPPLPTRPHHVVSLESAANKQNILVVYNCETWKPEQISNLEFTIAGCGTEFKICRFENDGVIYAQDARPSILDLEKIFASLSAAHAEYNLPLEMRVLALRMSVDISDDVAQMRADALDRSQIEASAES